MSAQSDYYSGGINLSGGQFGAPRDGGKRQHRGQDVSHSTKPGTVGVPALHAGTVISKTVPGPTHGFGYSIVIRSVLDGMEFDFRYAHGPWASQQAVGEWIPQGKIILHEGNSGATSGSCVHIEQQRVGGGFLDPLPEIKRVAAGRLTETAPAPAPAPAPAAVSDDTPPAGEYNPFGIKWSKGFQKLAARYGTPRYAGAIDGKWDVPNGGSIKSFTGWLRANGWYKGDNNPGVEWRKGVQRWLATRGSNPYRGKIDGDFGPQSKSSLYTAEAENYQQL